MRLITAERAIGRNGDTWIKVTFHPNQKIHARMECIPGSLYDATRKVWAVPYTQRAIFEELVGDFLIVWKGEDEKPGGIDESTLSAYPNISGYSVTYDSDGAIKSATGFKTAPWGEFQVRGFNALLERDFLILADDAGLGI